MKVDIPELPSKSISKLAFLAATYEKQILRRRQVKAKHQMHHLPHRYKPLKNCNSCAAKFYHSNVFDLPWVDDCPIHNTKLVEKCHLCSKPWPTITEMMQRDCEVCGVTVDIDKAIRGHKNFENNKLAAIAGHHEIYFENHTKLFPSAYFSSHPATYLYPSQRINQPSMLLISVLQNKQILPLSVEGYLANKGHHFTKFDTVSFSATPHDSKGESHPEPGSRSFNDEEKKRNLLVVRKALETQADHEIGGCERIKSSCFQCRVFWLWRAMLKAYEYSSYGPLMHSWEEELRVLCYPAKPSVIEYCDWLIMNTPYRTDLTYFAIPPFAHREIYAQNLKTAFIGFYHYVRTRDTLSNLPNKSLIDLNEALPFYSVQNSLFCTPYLAEHDQNKVTIYWPRIDIQESLADPNYYFEPKLKSLRDLSVLDVN